MTTFDTESELSKVALAYPGIKLVLRVRCDDPEVSHIVCSMIIGCISTSKALLAVKFPAAVVLACFGRGISSSRQAAAAVLHAVEAVSAHLPRLATYSYTISLTCRRAAPWV